MIINLLRFFRGYLLIEIRGNALERFINQIIELEINLWDLQRIKKDYYLAKIYINDFKRLRPLVKKRMCWVKILDKRGLPFIISGAQKRLFLLSGLILFLLILYLGSSFLWTIEITGLEKIPENKINQLLRDSGIRPGILKREIDTAELEKELLKGESRIAWVNVQWRGTQLYIEIVEKKIVEKPDTGNIFAAKNGLISKLIVLKGRAVVKEGDTVTKGQPLIITSKNQEQAIGIVKAHVWYEATGSSKLYLKEIEYTGRSKTIWGVKFREKIIWLTRDKPPYKKYQRERQIKRIPKWRNIDFPIELIKEKYKEVRYHQEKRSKDLCFYLAKKKAIEKIISEINPEGVILDIRTEEIAVSDPNLIKVRILVKVEEDIAKLKGGS
ncbi:MAG: hypothetical protein PWR10_1371 [Halanaerobiales bacterium]|nr:hypothetical protein [Halanaerobiales bacterium]